MVHPWRRYVRSLGSLVLGASLILWLPHAASKQAAVARAQTPSLSIPTFQVDRSWPKPLPNNWVIGGSGGLAIDARDHVWLIHRPTSVTPADVTGGKRIPPPVMEFDPAGNVVQAWGGPGPDYHWMEQHFGDYPRGTPPEHGIFVDHKDNVWVTGNGDQVLKFTRAGKFLMAIGQHMKTGGSNSTTLLGNPTDMAVDPVTNELFVSDGYLNRRVIVFDADTGKYKRHWGAYGKPPDDGPAELYEPGKPLPKQFFVVHCLALSKDGLVYVCDRQRNRIQVFRKDGTFVRERVIRKDKPAGAGIKARGFYQDKENSKLGFGSGQRIAFSSDPEQRYIYHVNDGVMILRRSDLEVVGSVPGAVVDHGMRMDSKGNLYLSQRGSPVRWTPTRMSSQR